MAVICSGVTCVMCIFIIYVLRVLVLDDSLGSHVGWKPFGYHGCPDFIKKWPALL